MSPDKTPRCIAAGLLLAVWMWWLRFGVLLKGLEFGTGVWKEVSSDIKRPDENPKICGLPNASLHRFGFTLILCVLPRPSVPESTEKRLKRHINLISLRLHMGKKVKSMGDGLIHVDQEILRSSTHPCWFDLSRFVQSNPLESSCYLRIQSRQRNGPAVE